MNILAIVSVALVAGGALVLLLMIWLFRDNKHESRVTTVHGRSVPWKDWDQEAHPPPPAGFRDGVWIALTVPFLFVALRLFEIFLWVAQLIGKAGLAERVADNLGYRE